MTIAAQGVQHLVYSSVGGVESQNRFYLEHGWGTIDEWQIEAHIRDLGLPATILRPGGFMEDFTSPARFFQSGSLNVPWHDFDTDPATLRKVYPDLEDFGTWLNRSGQARLLAQLESVSA